MSADAHRTKLVHVAYGTPPGLPLGDPLHYVLRLAAVQQAMGYDVTVAVAAPHDATEGGDVALRAIATPDGDGVGNDAPVATLARLLGDVAPELVHVHSLRGWSPDAIIHAHAAGAACVMSVLDYAGLCARGDLREHGVEVCAGPGPIRCAACAGEDDPLPLAERTVAALAECDVLLAAGERIRSVLTRQGVPASAIHLHGQGSDTAHELWRAVGQGRRDAARTQLVRDGGPLRLIMAGVHDRHSGLLRALDAVAQVPEVTLTLVGPLAADDVVVAPALAAVAERTCHISDVSLPSLVDAYRAADAALVIPEWEDPAPQSALHALGAAVPVIGTDIGAVPARVSDGATGLLVLPGSTQALVRAIERLADDRVLLPTLIRRIHSPAPMSAQAADLVPVYMTARRARQRALTAA